MSNSDLTLFHIESELAQLVSLREEMSEAGEDTAAVDQQIAEYIAREVRKVDGIRAYLRECDFMANGAKEEADRLTELANMWTARRDRLKAVVLRVMQDNGLTRLEGKTGTLLVRANPPKVEVQDDLDLLPIEYVRVVPEQRVPDKKAIAAALKEPCAACQGNGNYLGQEFDGVQPCPACGGDGKQRVPGARLVNSERLEVR